MVTDQPLVSVETDKAVVEVPHPLERPHCALVRLQGRPRQSRRAPCRVYGRCGARALEQLLVNSIEARNRRAGLKRHPSRRRCGPDRSFLRCGRLRTSSMSTSTSSMPLDRPVPSHGRTSERAAKSLIDAGPAEPLRGMRRAMAQRMAVAHAEVSPASVTDEADVDDWPKGEDITVRLVRAIAVACKAEPSLNAWYNAEAGAPTFG